MAEMIQVIDNNKKEVESVQAEIDSIQVDIRKGFKGPFKYQVIT